jgi:hypothetical protein
VVPSPASAESIAIAFRYGFLQKNDPVVCWMHMCNEAIEYWHQPSTEEEPVKAVDAPDPSPSVLMIGIPWFTPYIAAGHAVCGVRWHPTAIFFVSPPNAQKQAASSQYASDWL